MHQLLDFVFPVLLERKTRGSVGMINNAKPSQVAISWQLYPEISTGSNNNENRCDDHISERGRKHSGFERQ